MIIMYLISKSYSIKKNKKNTRISISRFFIFHRSVKRALTFNILVGNTNRVCKLLFNRRDSKFSGPDPKVLFGNKRISLILS